MTVFGLSLADILATLLALAFCGAGLFNACGGQSVRQGFVGWGYPAWWNLITGGLELAAAALIGWPPTRLAGLALASVICLAAIATVLRHREFGHLPPGLVLLALAGVDLALLAH
jgi:DoxX-like family